MNSVTSPPFASATANPPGGAELPFSPYISFSRSEWANLRADTPMTLVARDLEQLSGLMEELSLDEVEQIYLPLSRLLNLYVAAAQELHAVTNRFLGQRDGRVPFIIGIAGSVAVGLMNRKGFPESFDTLRLLQFLGEIKSGREIVTAPIYSHFHYDVMPGQFTRVERPDILIVEGLNVLQPARLPRDGTAIPFVSDFFDFSIYMDADPTTIESWYVARFLRLRNTAFRDPAAYFHRYAKLTQEQAVERAIEIWRTINLRNLEDNILPTRRRARLILQKGSSHRIEQVMLRRL
jgi:type I pantothenate kinase